MWWLWPSEEVGLCGVECFTATMAAAKPCDANFVAAADCGLVLAGYVAVGVDPESPTGTADTGRILA